MSLNELKLQNIVYMKKCYRPYVTGLIASLLLTISLSANAQNALISNMVMSASPIPSGPKNDSTTIKLIDRFSKTYQGVVVDSATNEPIQSAVVYLMGVTDLYKEIITKSTVTDKKGRFEILVAGPSKLEISCLGYKLHTQRIYTHHANSNQTSVSFNSMGIITDQQKQAIDLGKIKLAPDPYNADEVVVRARINMFEQRGDTTRIFPRLTKTLEGDALIEVIKQIPGFKVDGNTIYENGKKIERTYVNNTLLFGQEPITAFLKLSAESALLIDTYDEEITDTEKKLTNTSADTRRVANITTTKKVHEYLTMELLAESGVDHNKDIDGERNLRYGISGDIGLFKVGTQLSLLAKNNDLAITRSKWTDRIGFQNGNPKETEVALRYERQLGDSIYEERAKRKVYTHHGMLLTEYTFSDKKNINEGKSTSEYFPTNYFTTSIIENANNSTSKTQSHMGYVNYMGFKEFPFYVNVRATYDKNDNFNESMSSTTNDGVQISKTINNTQNKNDRFNINSSITFNQDLFKWESATEAKGIDLSLDNHIQYSKNNGDGLRMYTLEDQQGTNITNLVMDTDNPNINIGNRLELEWRKYSYKTSKSSRIGLTATHRYTNKKEKKIGINQATNEIDNAYSGDYTYNHKSLMFELKYGKVWSKRISSSIGVSYNMQTIKNDQIVPNEEFIEKDFNNMDVNFSLSLYNFMFALNTSSGLPSVEQLSSVLDNSNPMYLHAGNPNLKSERRYGANLNYSNRSFDKTRKVNIQAYANAMLSKDPITQIRHYFDKTTILKEYENYEAPAGATLYIPQNVGEYISVSGQVTLTHMIQRINTTIGLGIRGTYRNPYASINDKLMRNEQKDAAVEFSLQSTPNRNLRIGIENRLGFNWQENDSFKDRSKNNEFTINVRIDFLNRMTFTPEFSNKFNKAYTTGTTLEQNSLNLSLGVRMLKKRNGTLSINAYNIFNDNEGYYISVSDQAITESWSQRFARFYSISFKYKFNTIDHTK